MLWEVALSSTVKGTTGVWGASEVKLLLDAVTSALQVLQRCAYSRFTQTVIQILCSILREKLWGAIEI